MIDRAKKLLNPRYRFRDASTGKWVSRAYALLNPAATVGERVRKP